MLIQKRHAEMIKTSPPSLASEIWWVIVLAREVPWIWRFNGMAMKQDKEIYSLMCIPYFKAILVNETQRNQHPHGRIRQSEGDQWILMETCAWSLNATAGSSLYVLHACTHLTPSLRPPVKLVNIEKTLNALDIVCRNIEYNKMHNKSFATWACLNLS